MGLQNYDQYGAGIPAQEPQEVAAGEELPEEGREDTYEETDLYRALQQLDEKERTVVICKYFEDMTLDEIADTEKRNVNTVKSRLYRALKKLRGYLEEPAGAGSSRTGKRGCRLKDRDREENKDHRK